MDQAEKQRINEERIYTMRMKEMTKYHEEQTTHYKRIQEIEKEKDAIIEKTVNLMVRTYKNLKRVNTEEEANVIFIFNRENLKRMMIPKHKFDTKTLPPNNYTTKIYLYNSTI